MYKKITKEKLQERMNLEKQLKIPEKNLDEGDNLSKYNNIKNQLDAVYEHITKTYVLEANATGTKSAKNQQNVF